MNMDIYKSQSFNQGGIPILDVIVRVFATIDISNKSKMIPESDVTFRLEQHPISTS